MSHSEDAGERRIWRAPLWLVLALTSAWVAAGALWKMSCTDAYRQLCYTDITPLYVGRGLFDGIHLYLQTHEGRYLEYPVLTGAVMQVSGWIAGSGGDWQARTQAFLVVTSVILLAFALVMSTALYFTQAGTRIAGVGREVVDEARAIGPRAALMVAASPLLMLEGTINWDFVAVAFTALALYAWSRQAPLLTGVFIGLGAAAKLYPLFLLGPIVVLCLRGRRWNDLGRSVAGAAVAWLVANLPVMVLNFEGWKEFYSFSQSRGIDFGSPWLAWAYLGHDFLPTPQANTLGTALFLAGCVGVAVLAWLYPSAALAQLAFLVVAAFAITNKVYSPQYALWLLPLAALARPRWPAFLLWQIGEVVYFVAIWRFLLGYGQVPLPDGAMGDRVYAWTIVLHLVLTLGYAILVVVDVVREGRERSDGPGVTAGSGATAPG